MWGRVRVFIVILLIVGCYVIVLLIRVRTLSSRNINIRYVYRESVLISIYKWIVII